MDATVETTRGGHHFATFSYPKLDPLKHFNNFGLDFKYVFSHLSNPQNIPPDVLGSDSVSTRLEATFHQFWHTDVLRPGYDDESPDLGIVAPTSHDAHRDDQLVFLSRYPSSRSSLSLINIYNIKLEFWRRHLEFTLAASINQFENIKLFFAICDIFQLRI